MNNFLIFTVGLVVTLITGMGVITSQIFIAYNKFDIDSQILDTSNKTIQDII